MVLLENHFDISWPRAGSCKCTESITVIHTLILDDW